MRLLLLIFIIFSFSCKEQKRYANNNLSEYQKNVNDFFKDASVSPLKSKDLKNFKGLDFFESDSTYIVSARIKNQLTVHSKVCWNITRCFHFEGQTFRSFFNSSRNDIC